MSRTTSRDQVSPNASKPKLIGQWDLPVARFNPAPFTTIMKVILCQHVTQHPADVGRRRPPYVSGPGRGRVGRLDRARCDSPVVGTGRVQLPTRADGRARGRRELAQYASAAAV